MKKKNKVKKELKKIFSVKNIGILYLLISFILVYSSLDSFYIGRENVDVIYNFQSMLNTLQPNEDFDDWVDRGSDGNIKSFGEWHSFGLKQMKHGMNGIAIATALFFIGLILILKKDKRK